MAAAAPSTRVLLPASASEAEAATKAAGTVVLNFCATWAEPCELCNTVFAELAAEHTQLSFVQLDADTFPELCEKFNLESVPAFLFLTGGTLIDAVHGADVPTLVNKVKQQNLSASIAKGDGLDVSDATAAAAAPAASSASSGRRCCVPTGRAMPRRTATSTRGARSRPRRSRRTSASTLAIGCTKGSWPWAQPLPPSQPTRACEALHACCDYCCDHTRHLVKL